MPSERTVGALLAASERLAARVDALEFSAPVAYVYNPLRYAWRAWRTYITRFARSPIKVLLLGMNPGPWGMAQVGVPFGEIASVRDWMGIVEQIDRPETEHPKRPIEGFACSRSEVSGRRLWGLAADRYGSADAFFAEHFVGNYCPLVFMADSGRNITPDKLPALEREPLFCACDEHLRELVSALDPELVVGVGRFAEGRARAALGDGTPPKAGPERTAGNAKVPVIGTVLHPSPASPAANRGWAEQATRQLIALGAWS